MATVQIINGYHPDNACGSTCELGSWIYGICSFPKCHIYVNAKALLAGSIHLSSAQPVEKSTGTYVRRATSHYLNLKTYDMNELMNLLKGVCK